MPVAKKQNMEAETRDFYGAYWKEGSILLDITRKYLKKIADPKDFKGKDILDAGCGSGCNSLVFLTDYGANRVVGVDFSPQCIEKAESLKASAIGIDTQKLTFSVADVLDTKLGDNSFDTIYSSGVLHCTSSIENSFAELARSLRPGGVFYLGLCRQGWYVPVFNLANGFSRAMPGFVKKFMIGLMSLVYWIVEKLERKQTLTPLHIYGRVKDVMLVPHLVFLTEREIEDLYARNGFHRVEQIGRFGLFGNMFLWKGVKK